jgi:hypothetical protein
MIARGDDRPKFRQDLLAESVEDSGQRFIDVMDPDSGNLFRFYEVEFSLACAMDGERDVTGIVKWAQEELGVTPSPAEVRTVISTLGELGYLDGRAPQANAQPRPDELAPGVVVSKQPNARAGMNIELGAAGTNAARGQDMPKAADVALGAAGAQQHKRVQTPVDDVPLGTPGRPAYEARRTPRPMPAVQPPADVSLDLADQMSVKPDDVKEAVRASKVMKAVDVPPELRDALDNQVTGVRPGANEFETEQNTVPRSSTPMPASRPTPQPQPATQAERPAVELRRPPQGIERPSQQPQPHAERPATPMAPTTRWSTVILAALLIAVIGGAGAFFVWKYALKKSNEDAGGDKTSDQLSPKPVTPAPAPTPPPPPAIKLASEPAPPVEMKAGASANLEFVEAQKAVKKGDVLVRLGGHDRIERVIAENQSAIDKRVAPDVAMFQKRLEALQAASRPANEIKAAQDLYDGRKHDLEGRQKTINEKTAELEKLILKAPSDGDFAPGATKAGTRVASGDTLGTFTPAPLLVATFKPEGVPPAVDASVYVAVKGTEVNKLVCKVKSVDNGGVKVACPGDEGLVGKEVTYGGPAPEETIEMPPEPGTGSGSAAAGSATATPPTPKQPPPAPKPPTPAPAPPPSGSGSEPPKAEGSSAG